MAGFLRSILLAGAITAAGLSQALAAELYMFRRAGCPWCQAWDRTIGPIYDKSDLGQRLPLRQLDLDADPKPRLSLKTPVRYTPTFVLVDQEREVGRIEGYPGEAFFWGLLERLADKLPPELRDAKPDQS